jgi:hypothetical protein
VLVDLSTLIITASKEVRGLTPISRINTNSLKNHYFHEQEVFQRVGFLWNFIANYPLHFVLIREIRVSPDSPKTNPPSLGWRINRIGEFCCGFKLTALAK